MKSDRFLAPAAAALLLALSPLAASGAAEPISCDVLHDTEISLWARYVPGAERQTFELRLKVPASATRGVAERAYPVSVDGRQVSVLRLDPRHDGGLSGSLSFDSTATVEAPVNGAVPFPAGWPGVGQGGLVQVSGIGCRLQG